MTVYVALLRAVNVGGTGKLPMADLKSMCTKLGFAKVQTYIASGNVVFESRKSEGSVKAALESALREYAGKPVGVLIRTAAELEKILAANPFPKTAPNRTTVVFLDEPPPANALREIKNVVDEEVRLGKREIYISYGSGMASSKLKVPAAAVGTARNINTVAKLTQLASNPSSLR